MSRIFDALKKAEATREVSSHAPAPTPMPRAVARPANAGRSALPLLGAVEMGEDALKAMTSLRVSLESTLRDQPVRTILFLSAQGGEGTSTVALQFAQLLARDSSARPLVVDCSAGRPAYRVEEGQRCAMLERGLMSGPPEQSAVVASNLFVVPVTPELRAGRMIPPGTLREIIEANAAGFDWIILDGPPVLDSPDSASFGAIADGVVVVIQAGRTKRPVLSRTAELLAKSGSRLLGSVLNRRVLEIPEFIYRRI